MALWFTQGNMGPNIYQGKADLCPFLLGDTVTRKSNYNPCQIQVSVLPTCDLSAVFGRLRYGYSCMMHLCNQ